MWFTSAVLTALAYWGSIRMSVGSLKTDLEEEEDEKQHNEANSSSVPFVDGVCLRIHCQPRQLLTTSRCFNAPLCDFWQVPICSTHVIFVKRLLGIVKRVRGIVRHGLGIVRCVLDIVKRVLDIVKRFLGFSRCLTYCTIVFLLIKPNVS